MIVWYTYNHKHVMTHHTWRTWHHLMMWYYKHTYCSLFVYWLLLYILWDVLGFLFTIIPAFIIVFRKAEQVKWMILQWKMEVWWCFAVHVLFFNHGMDVYVFIIYTKIMIYTNSFGVVNIIIFVNKTLYFIYLIYFFWCECPTLMMW